LLNFVSNQEHPSNSGTPKTF